MLTKKEYQVLELRKKKLTQVDVASKLGITQAAVSKFERSAISKVKDSIKTLSIAKKMGIKIEEDFE